MMHKPSLDPMQAALDGELSPEARARFERQLAESPKARARWAALLEASRLLAAAPGAAPLASPRPGFSKRFQARLAERRSNTKMVWGMLALGLTAPVGTAVMAVLVVGSLLPGLLLTPHPVDWMSAQATGIGIGLADARTVLSALVVSAYTLASWALSQPLTWLAMTMGGAVAVAWLYLVRKLTLEVSLS
jgi:anti-sigma factor RsiW